MELRKEKAALLGFENHAAFVHEMRMAKHPKNVKEFLLSLSGMAMSSIFICPNENETSYILLTVLVIKL